MGFLKEKKKDTFIYTVPAFTQTGLVKHGFTCRLGGVSSGDYGSLNLAFHVGDDPDGVVKNREKILNLFGAKLSLLVASQQIHGNEVYVAGNKDRGSGSTSYDSAIPGTDALITNVPGVLLSSYFADCVPVAFLDPINQVVALAHAGWKGTVQRIVLLTIEKMAALFGSRPEACLAAIGPSIGQCCFQVDKSVVDRFAQDIEGYERYCILHSEEKWSLDLAGINEYLLMQGGVKPENITKSDLCTSCHHNYFFSYRKDGGRTGRQAALIMLNERSV